jgi:hypothetical protein
MSFAEFFMLYRVQGKIALRRNMFKMSETSPQMAIFLAKNWLGMSDRQELEHIGKGGGPIEVRQETKVIPQEMLQPALEAMVGAGVVKICEN